MAVVVWVVVVVDTLVNGITVVSVIVAGLVVIGEMETVVVVITVLVITVVIASVVVKVATSPMLQEDRMTTSIRAVSCGNQKPFS